MNIKRVGAAMGQPLAHHDDDLRRPVLGRRRQPAPDCDNSNTSLPAFGAFGVMDPNINPPRVQSCNVTLEKQLGTNWSATVNLSRPLTRITCGPRKR
jgi:hypothetical protein